MILVHAGNRIDVEGREQPRFPADRVASVGRRLGQLLEVLEPRGVVTATAAGADLLMAEAAIGRGIPLHVVLPFGRDRFLVESVEDQGGRWPEAYDRVMKHVLLSAGCSLRELELDADDAGYRAGNDGLLLRARELGGERVLAAVVNPRAGAGPGGVVDDFVEKAEASGLFVLTVDPLRT